MNAAERAVWLKERESGLGGTDVAVIVGAHLKDPGLFRTPFEVWASKVNLNLPFSIQQKETEAMYWGKALEAVIAERYAADTGFDLIECNHVIRHPKYPHFLASPDRIITNSIRKRGLEIKTSGRWSTYEWGPDGTDQAPLPYVIQVHWTAFCCGFEIMDLAGLISGNEYHLYRFGEDRRLCEMLADLADQFWRNNVLTKEPPLPASDEDRQTIVDYLYPQSNAKFREAMPEEREWMVEYDLIRARIGDLTKEGDSLKARLIESIGPHEGITTSNGKATYKTGKGKQEIDYAAAILSKGFTADDLVPFTHSKSGSRRFQLAMKGY